MQKVGEDVLAGDAAAQTAEVTEEQLVDLRAALSAIIDAQAALPVDTATLDGGAWQSFFCFFRLPFRPRQVRPPAFGGNLSPEEEEASALLVLVLRLLKRGKAAEATQAMTSTTKVCTDVDRMAATAGVVFQGLGVARSTASLSQLAAARELVVFDPAHVLSYLKDQEEGQAPPAALTAGRPHRRPASAFPGL